MYRIGVHGLDIGTSRVIRDICLEDILAEITDTFHSTSYRGELGMLVLIHS